MWRSKVLWLLSILGVGVVWGLATVHHARARRASLDDQQRRHRVAAVRARSPLDWAHWRGPNRNDTVAEDSGWAAGKWPLPAAVWRAEVGFGASSPLVVGDRCYALGWRRSASDAESASQLDAGAAERGLDTLFCLDATTGAMIWQRSYAAPSYGRWAVGDQASYRGPTSTPEYDAATGYLFTLSSDGELNCWDTRARGANRWHLNLYQQFDVGRRPKVSDSGQQRDYGYTTSPLVHGPWVIVEVGAKAGNLVAFDQRTGRQVWASAHQDEAGHTGGPVPIEVEGLPCMAILTLRRLVVVRLDADHAGATVATWPWTTAFANNIATPAVFENNVVLTSAYNQSAICRLRITLRGAEEVWRRRHLMSKVCSPVVYEGHVYWAWRQLHCLEFATGRTRWAGGRFGDPGSCIVTGDGRIVVWGHLGKLVLAETARRSPHAYRELAARTRLLGGEPWPHVVLSGGRLVCKNREGTIKMFLVGTKVR